jgi:hypothetical protein
MPEYTVVLSSIEQNAMEYISTDVDFWIQNAVHERARIAIEELVSDYIREKLAAGEAIVGTKEEMVMYSTLPSAEARNRESIEKMMSSPPPGTDSNGI